MHNVVLLFWHIPITLMPFENIVKKRAFQINLNLEFDILQSRRATQVLKRGGYGEECTNWHHCA